jgi:hypothetical protein
VGFELLIARRLHGLFPFALAFILLILPFPAAVKQFHNALTTPQTSNSWRLGVEGLAQGRRTLVFCEPLYIAKEPGYAFRNSRVIRVLNPSEYTRNQIEEMLNESISRRDLILFFYNQKRGRHGKLIERLLNERTYTHRQLCMPEKYPQWVVHLGLDTVLVFVPKDY